MQLIDGKSLAHTIREEVKKNCARAASAPGLAVLLVGDDPASQVYVNLKKHAAEEAGIRIDIRELPVTTSDNELEQIIQSWNANGAIHGILIQLPLPPGHDVARLIAAIDPLKDVDGFHPTTIKQLLEGKASIISPVHEAVLCLIAATGIDPRHKSTTILANSETFSLPLAYLLKRAGFVIAHMDADALNGEVLRASDVIISALGRPGFIRPDLVKPGAVLIDVGTAKDGSGRISGDVDADAFTNIDGWLTPVPGGVGPMTVALLLKNVLTLQEKSL